MKEEAQNDAKALFSLSLILVVSPVTGREGRSTGMSTAQIKRAALESELILEK